MAANIAGGPLTSAVGISFVVIVNQPSGSSSCTAGTWTLTPR